MSEWLKKKIEKFNNIEKNGFPVGRDFYLGKKIWHVGSENLECNGIVATPKQIEEFKNLYNEFIY